MNIFLIGYRGTGKTTVAKLLAAKLGRSWVDADVYLEQLAGKTIKEIFAADGEPVFRDWESKVVADLAERDSLVVALGGGAVMREQNRLAIAGRGRTVWLQANVETIYQRLSGDPTTAERRPNLTAAGGYNEINELLDRRSPIYRQCADLVVDTEGKTPAQVADEIVCGFNLLPSPNSASSSS